MKTPRLPLLAVICGTAFSLMAACPACAAGETNLQPTIKEAASLRQAEMPAEQPVITAQPPTMPTDEFGHELNYCQLPWDYLPGENQADAPSQIPALHLFMK
jgi:hypothetical protein